MKVGSDIPETNALVNAEIILQELLPLAIRQKCHQTLGIHRSTLCPSYCPALPGFSPLSRVHGFRVFLVFWVFKFSRVRVVADDRRSRCFRGVCTRFPGFPAHPLKQTMRMTIALYYAGAHFNRTKLCIKNWSQFSRDGQFSSTNHEQSKRLTSSFKLHQLG